MAAFYAVYHGPDGIRTIARRVHQMASTFASGVRAIGLSVEHDHFFDTVVVDVEDANSIHKRASEAGVNFRKLDEKRIGVSVDETTTSCDIQQLLSIIAGKDTGSTFDTAGHDSEVAIPEALLRETEYLQHPVFNLSLIHI